MTLDEAFAACDAKFSPATWRQVSGPDQDGIFTGCVEHGIAPSLRVFYRAGIAADALAGAVKKAPIPEPV